MIKIKNQLLTSKNAGNACLIVPVAPANLASEIKGLSNTGKEWVKTNDFQAKHGQVLLVASSSGRPERVLFGTGKATFDPFIAGKLAGSLPPGTYALSPKFEQPEEVIISILLGCYRFAQYKKVRQRDLALVCPDNVDRAEVMRIVEAVKLTRDLINTPANDLGPQELQDATFALARSYKVRPKAIRGDRLAKDFPLIHAVGRGSSRPPRLLDFSWGNARHPKVTLVGKGVVFDTGGLDIKPSSGMILMKKDMGGAANVLGLAQMVMDAKLPVRLRVLIPAVENAVGSDAFRPSDIIKSRKGLTVEIGNTDAEGRLVLADALTLADDESPEFLIDMATLTGAARVALGPDLPPFFVDDDGVAEELVQCGLKVCDPLWRMPFWRPYEAMLDSKIADTNNIGGGGFGGAITAALFLNKFVDKAKHHIHFDIYGWTPAAKPAKPHGGEAHAIRALYRFLQQRFQK